VVVGVLRRQRSELTRESAWWGNPEAWRGNVQGRYLLDITLQHQSLFNILDLLI
jgi:hypothetical protein